MTRVVNQQFNMVFNGLKQKVSYTVASLFVIIIKKEVRYVS